MLSTRKPEEGGVFWLINPNCQPITLKTRVNKGQIEMQFLGGDWKPFERDPDAKYLYRLGYDV